MEVAKISQWFIQFVRLFYHTGKAHQLEYGGPSLSSTCEFRIVELHGAKTEMMIQGFELWLYSALLQSEVGEKLKLAVFALMQASSFSLWIYQQVQEVKILSLAQKHLYYSNHKPDYFEYRNQPPELTHGQRKKSLELLNSVKTQDRLFRSDFKQ